jgi:hypothetical protein
MHFNNTFETIGIKYDTDKVTHHGYQRTYPIFLEHFRNNEFSMLEIGLSRSGSLKLWKEYFPKCTIYGIDSLADLKEEGVIIFKADQSDTTDLARVSDKIPGKLKFILDDGSHVPDHQLISLNFLWDKLEDGGVYIIEDIETSYWKNAEIYGYKFSAGIESPDSFVNQFKEICHIINREFFKDKREIYHSKINKEVLDGIESLTFCHNAIILVKKNPLWGKYYDRDYRLKSRADNEWL